MCYKYILLLAAILKVQAELGWIDSDYFFSGKVFRTSNTCESSCKSRCGELGVCIEEKCLCITVKEADKVQPKKSLHNDYELLVERPILRHHIAHFCPSMEKAKECVRSCMTVGKPAFCGKDHVCYCGHKYSNKDMEPQIPVSDIYAQFKDLYAKYFGNQEDADVD
ncbi:unnamed protein product [Leptidea sinapis]|uniref:Invertebrate defensins family profile domain-containing protein n=1 Tax=Leptidea sinapis TaxID=189913 RepID=A0A5E4PZW7_9NEOP|nr:unnamed protein product [Leptidea sinapis]